jgi:hypothetical protein
VRIAVGSLYFENAIANFKDRDIERAATEVVHGDLFVFLFVEAVSEGCRGRLVDDAQDFESGNFSRVLGCLPLRVIEVSGHRNYRLSDLLAQAHFGIGLQLAQNHCRNFRRTENLRFAFNFDFDASVAVWTRNYLIGNTLLLFVHFGEFAAHEAFDGVNRVARIGDGLPFRSIADQSLARLAECNH